MSDHYIEATIDTTTQSFPAERLVSAVRVRLLRFQCLQTTRGLGDDEVTLTVGVRPAVWATVFQSTDKIEDIGAGTEHRFGLPVLEVLDPGEEVDMIVGGREVDSLSADDALGRETLTYASDELLAIADLGPTRVGIPLMRGDESEYAVEIEISVEST